VKSGRYQRVEGLTTLDVNRMQFSARKNGLHWLKLSMHSLEHNNDRSGFNCIQLHLAESCGNSAEHESLSFVFKQRQGKVKFKSVQHVLLLSKLCKAL
jgi:hypothetical protein